MAYSTALGEIRQAVSGQADQAAFDNALVNLAKLGYDSFSRRFLLGLKAIRLRGTRAVEIVGNASKDQREQLSELLTKSQVCIRDGDNWWKIRPELGICFNPLQPPKTGQIENCNPMAPAQPVLNDDGPKEMEVCRGCRSNKLYFSNNPAMTSRVCVDCGLETRSCDFFKV